MKIFQSAVLTLISLCVLMFLLVNQLHIIPERLVALYFPENGNFRVWQFITHLFVHASFAHILFNMIALWMFGMALEKIWGAKRFLIFYFICGLGAALIYTLVNYYQFNATYNELLKLGVNTQAIQHLLDSGTVDRQILKYISEADLMKFITIYQSPAVGASGAIYGVLIAFAITYPNVKLILIFLPVPISAKYFVPILILADLFFGVTKYSVGNIAHFAHLGGALSGLLVMLWWRYRRVYFKN